MKQVNINKEIKKELNAKHAIIDFEYEEQSRKRQESTLEYLNNCKRDLEFYQYVMERVNAISNYSNIFFQTKGLEVLLKRLYKALEDKEADEQMIIDFINDIEYTLETKLRSTILITPASKTKKKTNH